MAIDDRLYDPQPAPDHRFMVYSPINTYITPYASDDQGGNLLSEFNQKAPLNALLKKNLDLSDYADLVADTVNETFGVDVEVDSMTGQTARSGPGLYSFESGTLHDRANWQVISYATGTRDADGFSLRIVGDKLSVSAGVALVYGYYIESATEINIDLLDVINQAEVVEVMNNPGQNPASPCRTKLVKLAVQYTVNINQRHDERLVPPAYGVYPSTAIVINEELPYGNELLLGTVTRNSEGRFIVTQNPYKTRLVPLDSVQGAEGYAELIKAVEGDKIYGVKAGGTDGGTEGEITNLQDITPWLWIAFDSNLGKLLRSMSTNADTAGNSTDEPTRGIIVSDAVPYTADDPVVDAFNCLQRIDAKTGDAFARMSWHQAQTPPKTGADLIDHRALYFPYAMSRADGSSLLFEKKIPRKDKTIMKPFYDVTAYPCLNGLNGTDGIMTYQQLAMLELVFDDYIHRQADGYARGRQYGPFLTLDDAKNWFERHKPVIHLGDYFWVINDTAEAGGTEANSSTSGYELQNIVTNYGTVSGTVTGTAKQSKLEVKVTGSVTGQTEGETPVDISGEVTGTGQGTINATVSGTVTGTLDSFIQNVSSRYVCRYQKAESEEGLWRFSHAVMMEENKVDGKFTSTTLEAPVRPGSLLIVPAPGAPVHTQAGGTISTPIFDNGYGELYPDSSLQVLLGTINYDTGIISGLIPQQEAAITYFVDGADAGYMVLDPEGQSRSFQDTSSTPQSVLFAVESVERGFAVPATYNTFGVVKTGTGSDLSDVIVDATTQRLRITDLLVNLIKGGGYADYMSDTIRISPNMDLSQYSYRRYADGVTFKMEGNASEWRAVLDTTGTLGHLRGKVTLDFSEVIEDGQRSDGLLLHLVDIDELILKGDNVATTIHPSTETLMFGVDHCVVDRYFFTNIGKWKYSRFISGGNTLEIDVPWMQVTDVFTNTTDNSLLCKFSSVTMGEDGITSAQMDIWVKHAGWDNYSGNVDRMWSSANALRFPPMFFEHELGEDGSELSSINKTTIQYIPSNLNLKISGTSGVHQAYDEGNSEYVPGGNLLVNLNWEYNGNPASANDPAGKIYLNLYMKNSSPEDYKQNFSNLRFRANVQVIRLDDNSMADSVSYAELY